MGGDSDKETALDALYRSALEQEMEILRLRKSAGLSRPMGSWQPPTEDEFNDHWITPLEALDVSDDRMAEDHEKWALLEQLRAGQILAVARTAQVNPTVGAVQPFVRISAGAWRRAGQSEQFNFWKTGHLVVPGVEKTDDYGGVLTGEKERYFNVRFDPASFDGRPPPPEPDDGAEAAAPAAVERGKEISTEEAKRFSVAILAGWPDATESFAHAKALAFYSQNKVPREWFLGIFRSIRGPKSRGKQPKKRD